MPYLLITLVAVVLGIAVAVFAPTARAHHTPHPIPGKGDQSWQWKWQVWLPDKWQRIGACETGYGKRPGDWTWNSGTYQGAFGFYHGSWDQFKPVSWWPDEAYLASPWQQYQTALAIWRRFGFSGWGCRNA